MTMPLGGEPIKKYRVIVNGRQTGHVAELRSVPVAEVQRESVYQRNLNSTWINGHRPFVEALAGTVTISLRAGILFVVDGGHRVELAKLSGVKMIRAFVIPGLTLQEEAALFVKLQRERRSLSAWDLYRAELAGQEPETLAMQAAILKHGFQIDQTTKGDPHIITAIDSVRFVHRLGGPVLIGEVLTLIGDAMWLNLDKSLSGPILKGLGIFLHSEKQRPAYENDRTIAVLRKNAPVFVLLKAQQIAIERRSASVSATNVAQAILDSYNDRLGASRKLPPITINNRKRPAPKATRKV